MATKKSAKKVARSAPKAGSASKKTSTKKAAKKATAKKATAKKATAKKATAKKATAKKATAKKATAKKVSPTKPALKKAASGARATPSEGAAAPAFRLMGDDGREHALADHRGAPVVLYFYPKDDTPGCTIEACDFRDRMNRVAAAGAVVYGVSRDSIASHLKFKAKYGLTFTLLSDPDLVAHRAYGAFGTKNMYGKLVEGTIRSTYLIDGDGRVKRAWPTVKVAGHVDDVLSSL